MSMDKDCQGTETIRVDLGGFALLSPLWYNSTVCVTENLGRAPPGLPDLHPEFQELVAGTEESLHPGYSQSVPGPLPCFSWDA